MASGDEREPGDTTMSDTPLRTHSSASVEQNVAATSAGERSSRPAGAGPSGTPAVVRGGVTTPAGRDTRSSGRDRG